MRYAIGLDLGIQSVGYSVLELDSQDNPRRIEKLGSRVFDIAEVPKTGESLAKNRREKRSQRRLIRRRRHRIERIKAMLVSNGILTKEELDSLYDGIQSDIYELRTFALDNPVTNKEFAKILLNLAHRRGFKSNRKNVSEKSEDGVLLSKINENKLLCTEKNYRTVGEMFFKDEKFAEYKRNRGGSYIASVGRGDIENEAEKIFEAQKGLGNSFANDTIKERYLSILLAQRSFADGPGAGPYSGNQIEKMVGKCTFLSDEPRASKASYSFQIFDLWQNINHLRIRRDGEVVSLTDTERREIFNKSHEQVNIDYSNLRKWLCLGEKDTFVGVPYRSEKLKDDEKKKKWKSLAIYHEISKAIGEEYINLGNDKKDKVGEILSKNYSDDELTIKLGQIPLSRESVEKALVLPNYSKYGHLSLAALTKLIPYLEEGMTYDKACAAAGFVIETTQKFTLPPVPQDDNTITSPVVRRTVSQAIKVINSIIREQNASPVYINIELARELSHNLKERRDIQKAQDDNADRNEKAMGRLAEQLKEYGIAKDNHSGLDLVKFKLWEQQDGICLYSGEKILISRLLEPGYVDVDHIAPYSKTFDDRMSNKVLVMTEQNRIKGNRLPLEYLSKKKKDEFIVRVECSDTIPASKKRRLLMEHLSDEKEWKERNLVDTQFASSFLAKYIDANLLFAPYYTKRKRHVFCINGAITAYVRKRWGILKIRENGDLHHAVDATVIACITQGMVNTITNYSKYNECKYYIPEELTDKETGEVIDDCPTFPEPWEGFRRELQIRTEYSTDEMRHLLTEMNPSNYEGVDIDSLKAPFVSRMSNHKITGAAHKETARSGKYFDENIVVSKTPISKLKLNSDGEIEGYFNKSSDILLYEALKKRLQAFDGKGDKAFAEPFFKPKSNGEQGPRVKSVKTIDTASKAVSIQNHTAIADNDSMVRCDVFYVKDDGYYLVPIYVSDTVSPKLPNKACVAGKRPWKEMKEEDFCFSLFKNDLIKIYSKKDLDMKLIFQESSLPQNKIMPCNNGVLLYYNSTDIATASIKIINHDNTYYIKGLGVKSLLKIEKYSIDTLGNISLKNNETRENFI